MDGYAQATDGVSVSGHGCFLLLTIQRHAKSSCIRFADRRLVSVAGIIGKVPNYANLKKRIFAWCGGIAAAAVISIGAFHYLEQVKELDWQDYNEARLQQLQNEGKTVMIDFGAKWCVNCIVNYEVALNTATTRKVIDELNAVAMYADWTDPDDKIKQKLSELDSRSIPLLVIYPGDRKKEPIIMRDLVTQQAVVDALRRAGASVGSSSLSFSGRNQNLATVVPQ